MQFLRLGLVMLVSVLLLSFGAAPVAAASGPDTNVGCGGEVVEVCFPVCVQAPCPAYVCVHSRAAEICQTV